MIIELAYLSGFIILMLSLSITSIVIAYSYKSSVSNKYRLEQINNTESYLAILHQQMDKAYQMIYNDRIMPYSLESHRLSEEEYNEVLKEYIKLVSKFLGPSLYDDLASYFGDENALMLNISEYFNTRYENDEIRKSSMDSFMNSAE